MNGEIPVNEYIARQMGELHVQLCIKSAQLDAARAEIDALRQQLVAQIKATESEKE